MRWGTCFFPLRAINRQSLRTSPSSVVMLCYLPSVFREMSQTRRHIDHDHRGGQIRGILCGQCNSMLRMARGDIGVLERAIEYLGGGHSPECPFRRPGWGEGARFVRAEGNDSGGAASHSPKDVLGHPAQSSLARCAPARTPAAKPALKSSNPRRGNGASGATGVRLYGPWICL